jgi:hypothetical protein
MKFCVGLFLCFIESFCRYLVVLSLVATPLKAETQEIMEVIAVVLGVGEH